MKAKTEEGDHGVQQEPASGGEAVTNAVKAAKETAAEVAKLAKEKADLFRDRVLAHYAAPKVALRKPGYKAEPGEKPGMTSDAPLGAKAASEA